MKIRIKTGIWDKKEDEIIRFLISLQYFYIPLIMIYLLLSYYQKTILGVVINTIYLLVPTIVILSYNKWRKTHGKRSRGDKVQKIKSKKDKDSSEEISRDNKSTLRNS